MELKILSILPVFISAENCNINIIVRVCPHKIPSLDTHFVDVSFLRLFAEHTWEYNVIIFVELLQGKMIDTK